MQGTFLVSIYVGVLFILFYTPYLFAKGIYSIEYGVLRFSDKVKCTVPLFNISTAEVMFNGKKVSSLCITGLLSLASIVTKIAVIFLMSDNGIAQGVTSILFFASLAAFYINNVIVVFYIIYHADVAGICKTALLSILYPVGQFYIGSYLPTVLKNVKSKGDVFK